jgi:hypothetical protein
VYRSVQPLFAEGASVPASWRRSCLIATLQGSQPRAHRLAVGKLLAQLEWQLAQQALGFVDEVPTAGQDRPAPAVPERQQLVQLIRPLVLSGALNLNALGSSGCASVYRAIRSESSVSDLPR